MKGPSSRISVSGWLVVIWLLVVVAAYFVVHKPLGPAAAGRIAGVAGQLAVGLVVLAVAGGLGRRLLGSLPAHPALRIAIPAAVGLGIFSVLLLGLGSILRITGWIAWSLLGVSLALLHHETRRWVRDLLLLARVFRKPDRFGRLCLMLAGFGMLTTLFPAAAPPVQFDALVYHLALPQTYLASGRVSYVPDNMFWGMPQLGEMLYTWLLALTGTASSAALFGWLASGLALVGLFGYVAQRFSLREAAVAPAILLSGATLLRSTSWAYVDWFAALYGIVVVACLDPGLDGGAVWERRRFWLAGALAGFALGVKYTAGVILPAGVAGILLAMPDGIAFRSRIRQAVVFGTGAFAVSLPWWMKNVVFTGNPFYPFFVPAGTMTAGRLALYSGQPAFGGLENALLLPWQATISGLEGAPGFSASIGPLLLALAPLAGLGWHALGSDRRLTLRFLAASSIAGLLVWAVVGRLSGLLIQSRLYFILFPSLAVLAAAGLEALGRVVWPGVRLRRIGRLLVVIVVSLNLFQVGSETLAGGAPAYILGQEDASTYRAHHLGMLELALQAVSELPENARVLFLYEPRGLTCPLRCDPDEILDRWPVDAAAGRRDEERILQAWREEGFSHVLFHRAGAAFFREDPRFPREDWLALDAVVTRLEPLADLNGVYLLFEIP